MIFQKKLPVTLNLPFKKGMRIGIFGGSFDPLHEGHIQTALTALKKEKLDRILWVVSPQNPLKIHKPQPINERLLELKKKLSHPKFIVTNFEEEFGLRYSYHTISMLQKRYRECEFMFVIGADNLKSLPRWYGYKKLLGLCKWVVVARPNTGFHIRFLPAYQNAKNISFYNQRLNTLSSTALRDL